MLQGGEGLPSPARTALQRSAGLWRRPRRVWEPLCVEALGLQSLKHASWPLLHCAVSWGVPAALIEPGSLGPGPGQPLGDADESRCIRELPP